MAKVQSASVNVKVKAGKGAVVDVKVRVEGKKKRKGKGLTFGKGNAKLGSGVKTFSLPAGWSCPFASACMARADRKTGKLKDGPETEFRCFSASDEARHPSARASRWRNFKALKGKSAEGMARVILESIPKGATVVRIHVSGDFFSLAYLDAWILVARLRPDVAFYFYTKSLRYWVQRLEAIGDGHEAGAVANFVPTASRGGKDDELIDVYGLRSAVVVYSEKEAEDRGLTIDHDDSHAMKHGGDFALLLHGMQPPKSAASKALSALRAAGEYGYGKAADARREGGRRVALATV